MVLARSISVPEAWHLANRLIGHDQRSEPLRDFATGIYPSIPEALIFLLIV